MDLIKWTYYQYRKQFNYSVYLRFKQDELNPKYVHVLNEMGFVEISEAEVKKIPLAHTHTKILSIQNASARLQQQIMGSDLLDKYGHETLALQSGLPIYTYRKVGVMGAPGGKTIWELAIHPDISHTDQMVGLRIILVRYLALALAEQGVLCYWGTVKEETVVAMKQHQSFGEAVLIDLNKRMIFSNAGEMKFNSSLKIIRKDKDVKTPAVMKREEIISFLTVSTCLLSFSGITNAMKRAIYEISSYSTATYAASENGLNL